MINRPGYIAAIAPFIDQPLVKTLAGVRRCGKSTIFEMLKEEFLRRGIPQDHIISKRYTEMDISENITARQMYDELVEAMKGKGHCYLLLDEIQEIDGWERAVNSLLEGADADIYVTGSNSKLMSSEISTYLTGRYVSIPSKSIWTLRQTAPCPAGNCWRNTFALAVFQSLRLVSMTSRVPIKLSTAFIIP